VGQTFLSAGAGVADIRVCPTNGFLDAFVLISVRLGDGTDLGLAWNADRGRAVSAHFSSTHEQVVSS
jgi:hypothetical protein